MIPFLPASAALLLGWALGSNDAANVFGAAVATRLIRFRSAAVLASVFILAGALVQGSRGMVTLGALTDHSAATAAIALFASGITVASMTALKLPVSTSQAIVGAILGVATVNGTCDFAPLRKIVICWIATPAAAAGLAALGYVALARALSRMRLSVMRIDYLMRAGTILAGCYGAYALGANNIANVAGVLTSAGILEPFWAAALGGVAIALGVHTFSRQVMYTVGLRLVPLGAMSAFVALAAHALSLHIFAMIGVPVSSSQAIVGAVLGIGLVKGVHTVQSRTLLAVLVGWFATPALAFALAFALSFLPFLR